VPEARASSSPGHLSKACPTRARLRRRLYADPTRPAEAGGFAASALARLDITVDVESSTIARIPASGSLVVVANHPHGAADGLALLATLQRVRPDVKLLGNFLLQRIPELRASVIAVDPFGGARAQSLNRQMLRQAIDWVARGGALIVFPAGEVSNVPAARRRLVDPEWRPGVARILEATQAPVLPVYFDGRNGRLFELAGRVHPALRTALLGRELLRLRGESMRPVVGAQIPYERVARFETTAARLDYLRARTYGLAPAVAARPRKSNEPVAPPESTPDELAAEVARLPVARRLLEAGDFDVFHASAAEIPRVLREIGRLREIAFRAAGEGSGRALDLDGFDRHYFHLFVWERGARRIVGAYRLGPTDAIVSRLGVRGLYTRTLFRYSTPFVEALGPALELGRSFVRVECQREFAPLLLLWQGIGRFLARHPRYRRLFGPVSISAAYSGASRDALVDLLEAPAFRSGLSALVRPLRAYQGASRPRRPVVSTTPEDVQAVIGDVEPDGKGVPVLIRQYLKLNAKVAAISVDPGFSDVVDALSIVNVDDIPPAMKRRILG
jgi:putative hemolysin